MAKSKKGSQYERQFCKALSLWYSESMLEETRDDLFWRTAGSGARATSRKKKGIDTVNSCGDVGALDATAQPFTDLCMIELKRGYTTKRSNDSISLLNMIDKATTKRKQNAPALLQWLRKAKREARSHGVKHFAIVFRRDRKVSCIILMNNTFDMLCENNRPWTFPHDGPIAHFQIKRFKFCVMRFEDFVAWCPAKAFFQKVEKLGRRSKYRLGKYGKSKAHLFPKGFA